MLVSASPRFKTNADSVSIQINACSINSTGIFHSPHAPSSSAQRAGHSIYFFAILDIVWRPLANRTSGAKSLCSEVAARQGSWVAFLVNPLPASKQNFDLQELQFSKCQRIQACLHPRQWHSSGGQHRSRRSARIGQQRSWERRLDGEAFRGAFRHSGRPDEQRSLWPALPRSCTPLNKDPSSHLFDSANGRSVRET